MAWNFRSRHQELRRLLEAARRDSPDAKPFWRDLREAFSKGHLKGEDLSIRLLFENFVPDGREIADSWSLLHQGQKGIMLTEAGDAVKTSDFADITGQWLFNRVLEAYNDPVLLWPRIITTVPTQFNGERVPGIARIGDKAESVGESEPYPLAGVSQEYIETPMTTKRGMIVPVTKEAVFFDRTGILLQRASEVGYWLGVNKEKRVLDVVLGINNNYKRNGEEYDTYGPIAGFKDFDNLVTTNPLYDWTNVEASMLAFDGITDPNTGEPILIGGQDIIVPSALKMTARRVIRATGIMHVDNQANAQTIRTASANPLDEHNILSNQYVYSRGGSKTTWWHGDPKRAFSYMENWPITTVSAPPNNELEFSQDIVHREKVSERGVAAVTEPRRMVKNTQ